MTRHLVIFARAPQFGRVKRRLAKTIGTAEATRVFAAQRFAARPRLLSNVVLAGALGAVDGAAADALEQIAAKAGGPVYAAIDLVGNEQTAQLGFDCLTKGGKLVMVGLFGGGAPWALPLIPMKAITIQGSYVGNLRETEELLDLVRTKKIAPIPVTTMPLTKADEALNALRSGKLVGRAVLTP